MMRVRACTMRCRCHSSCRRSRFSQFGTQIGGKSSFSNKLRICCASCRSVFCLTSALAPYLGRISHPQLELQLRQQAVEPACVSAGFHADTYLLTRRRQSTIELLRALPVCEPLLLQFSGSCIDKSNLLEARMVITPYNDHVRLLSPSLLVGF